MERYGAGRLAVAGVDEAVGVHFVRRGIRESLRRQIHVHQARLLVMGRAVSDAGCAVVGQGVPLLLCWMQMAARKAAVVATTCELLHFVQLMAAARVSCRGFIRVTESTSRCRSVSQVPHQGVRPRGWWASRGRYELDVTVIGLRPGPGSWP